MGLSSERARELVDPALRPMRHALRLNDWRVEVRYEAIGGGYMGQCQVSLEYKRATILVDAALHDEESEVLDTLRHELLHLTHAYYEGARQAVGQHLRGDAFDCVDVSFRLGAEHTVLAIENLLDSTGLAPERLVEIGREQLGEGA